MNFLTSADISAITLSLQVALTTTIVTLPAGFLVAYLLAMKNFRGKTLIEGIINLPLVLPPGCSTPCRFPFVVSRAPGPPYLIQPSVS